MKRKKIGYKVVRVRDLTSVFMAGTVLAVKYSTKKFVRPRVKGTKLFVFKRLDDARAYARFCPDAAVYRAELRNPTKASFLDRELIISALRTFFKLRYTTQTKLYCPRFDWETLTADAVKLLERV